VVLRFRERQIEFIREHGVDNVSINGIPQSENPKIKEVLKEMAPNDG
jgi:hypothetical protein